MNRTIQQLLVKSISESMDIPTMLKVMRTLFNNYNVHERMGWPENIPLQAYHVARQITDDIMREEGSFLKFITILIDVHRNGLMGKKITIKFLSQILSELDSLGLSFNPELGTFIESNRDKVSKSWRILEEENIYEFCLLKVDIVKNTNLVREYSPDIIKDTYSDFRNIVKMQVEKRDGRIWGWEGDGGLAAFYFQDKNVKAALSAIEILLELFYYNLFKRRLKQMLEVRIALHTGQCPFYQDISRIKSDTISILDALESQHTLPNTITLSPSVYHDLGRKLESCFFPIELKRGHFIYRYQMIWES